MSIYNEHPSTRTNMTIALSDDDGATWKHREILFAKFTEDDVISKKDIEISTVSKPKL